LFLKIRPAALLNTPTNRGGGLTGVSVKTAASLFDLGILFVLFMGGMEVDLTAFKSNWNRVLVNGLGQVILNLGLFTGLGVWLFRDAGWVPWVYFGLCCTLSSTILVLGCLKKRAEMEMLHSQVTVSNLPPPCFLATRPSPRESE
jgi:Kef-type K+ transport system membrane component KefB